MTQLLLRLFVKDYRNTEDPAVRTRYGKLAGIVGIVCNVLLSAGKLLAGTLSGAVSITADGLNNLSDAASSLVTLLGFRLAERPADEEHPFGHARMEYLSGLFVSVLILLVGAELARSSFEKILHPEPVAFSALSFAVLGASILVKLWMALFCGGRSRRIGSTALRATAQDGGRAHRLRARPCATLAGGRLDRPACGAVHPLVRLVRGEGYHQPAAWRACERGAGAVHLPAHPVA